MDELGIASGVIGASVLKPTIPGCTVVGPALTVRNIPQYTDPIEGARQHVNRMAEFEAHNLAQQGDVLVIQGVANVSNMGGISAQTGKRQGEIGAIVQGGVRDVAHSRALDYPVWASDITPVTGKWRIETVEINGPVQIGEVRVAAGDLVVPASHSAGVAATAFCSGRSAAAKIAGERLRAKRKTAMIV
jgi:regulator of RNase E activity RraA